MAPRTALVVALALAGCGSNPGATKPQVVPTATPPASEQLKYDLLTAAIQLDSYKLLEHTFTADERRLGPAFPDTVTIKTADANDFYLAAYDNHHIRYALRRTGDTTVRTCAPANPDVCPDGQW